MSVISSDILIRLGLSVLVGFFVGLERERHHRPAGIKTHILVCMGATVVSLIQLEMVADIITRISNNPSLAGVLSTDYGRLSAQVISGIGFLGAGTILRTKGSIKGLTTAATLWMVACVGIGIGMGYYFISIAAFVFVMIVLTLLRFIQQIIGRKKGVNEIEFSIVNKKETMDLIAEYFNSKFIDIRAISFPEEQEEQLHFGLPIIHCTYSVSLPRNVDLNRVMMDLATENNILKVNEFTE